MASPTWWTWVWANSRSWWRTGRPGVLQFMGLQSQTRLSNLTKLRSCMMSVLRTVHPEGQTNLPSHQKLLEDLAPWFRNSTDWVPPIPGGFSCRWMDGHQLETRDTGSKDLRLPLYPECESKCAFVVKYGIFKFCCVRFLWNCAFPLKKQTGP